MATTDELDREPGSPGGGPSAPGEGGSARGNAAWLAAVGAGVFALLLSPFVIRGWHFPLGPDTPVYLWWTRIAGAEGLSAVGARPGEPALALITQGTLHLRLVAVAGGLEIALSVVLALAAAALVHGRLALRDASSTGDASARRDRPEWILAGLFAGAFSIHLAGGYLSNLVFAAGFVAAGALLARGTRRGAIAAAVVLGGTGLAHPEFFALGLGILAVAAIPSLVRDRGRGPMLDQEYGRIGLAIAGGVLVVGAGLAAMFGGPRPLDVDTSKDAILRRLGLGEELRSDYVSRFFSRWTRYVPYVQVPLALAGLKQATGFAGRFLRSWAGISLAGVAVGLVFRWYPPDRFVTFAFAVPILAALGLVRLWHALERRRALAIAICVVLGAVVIGGPVYAWFNQKPWIEQDEVAAANAAGDLVEASPPGTRFVFLADWTAPAGAFDAARAGNLIRSAVPADRLRDVTVRIVQVPGPNEDGPGIQQQAAYLSLRAASRPGAPPGSPVYMVVAPLAERFAPLARSAGMTTVAPGVFASRIPAASTPQSAPLEPTSPGGLAVAALVIVLLLLVVGYGWSRIVFGADEDSLVGAFGTAPGLGLGVLVLVGVVLERLGLPLSGVAGPTTVAVLAGGSGYLVAFVLERRAVPQTPAEVEREDHE